MKKNTFLKTLFILLLIVCCTNYIKAQIITPNRYWTFNGTISSGNVLDSISNTVLNLTNYGGTYISNTGPVGKSIELNQNSSWCYSSTGFVINNGLTIEFLFKPGYRFNTISSAIVGDQISNKYVISCNQDYIEFYTVHTSSGGVTTYDAFQVTFNGTGAKNWGYYMDGNWHHMVFKFNPGTGTKEIWVDGKLPNGFSKTGIATGSFNNSNVAVSLNSTTSYSKYHGGLDELAIYNTPIPSSLIYKHYLNFQSGQPYSFLNDYTGTIPSAAPTSAPLDVLEFAPGHILGQLTNGTSSGVNVLPTVQIDNFPNPRYKPGHTLLRNFNWMDPKYMGGTFAPWNTSTLQVGQDSKKICERLALEFNYYIPINVYGAANDPRDTCLVKLANQYPNIQTSTISFRGVLSNGQSINSQNYPNNYYLRNSSGQFIDANGNVTSNKTWSPAAPSNGYAVDGNSHVNYMNSSSSIWPMLTRPLDGIWNDNNEIYPIISNSAMQSDPSVVADKAAVGANLTYQEYFSKKVAANEKQSFSDIWHTHPKATNAKYSIYALDGFPTSTGLGVFEWSEIKKAQDKIKNRYYPTSSIYPRYPSNWRNWMGAWRGFQWTIISRYNEIAQADTFMSPFIACGWDANEEGNIRPAQWLGFLKIMNGFGSEFFYTGFFTLQAPWPDSRNWIWQAVTPSYAQATISRVSDLYENSYLLNGDVPQGYINNTNLPGYNFLTGDNRKFVVIRKHNTSNKYIIFSTIQPNNSMIGNAEMETTIPATITLDGQTVKFHTRRYGSVYVYDKTVTPAVFYQLDGWHEYKHYWYWTKDFNLEAELFDNINNSTIKTSVPSGAQSGDYTNFTSYLSWNGTPNSVEYKITNKAVSNYYLWVRAKSKDGSSTGLTIKLDNGTNKTISCITDTNWVWYRYEYPSNSIISYSNLTVGEHTLSVTATNDKLYLDKIILTTNSNLGLNNNGPNCSTQPPVATITAGGATTFCQGGSVTLTANAGISYLWSNGATTQSINVTTSGNYSCSVTTINGTATSNIIAVTVNSLPTATISASGPTTFCQGGNVTLTASNSNSYLWSNGETTQSINVTTSGNYSVTITDLNNCSNTSLPTTITVTTCTTCSIPTGQVNVSIQSNSATISWNAVPGATRGYTIRLRNMTTLTNQFINVTTNSAVLTVNPGTKYRWAVRSKCANNVNSAYSINKVFTTPAVRIMESVVPTEEPIKPNCKIEDFDLFPNPANTLINMCFKSPVKSKVKIIFYNKAGQISKIHELNSELDVNSLSLDISELLPGLYNVKIISDSFIYSKQLTIIR